MPCQNILLLINNNSSQLNLIILGKSFYQNEVWTESSGVL
ncbi:MAG: hypothetical protein ACI92Z_001293 [Paracoccaceae bacterium]|jgi:hypothetical protein